MKKYCRFIIFLTFVFLLSANVVDGVTQAPTGEIRIVFPSLWNEAFDPILSMSRGRTALCVLYDSLVGADPVTRDFSKETGVARDWKMSADGKAWTFHLRKGIQFHRGFGELTAEDVKFSLERIKSEKSVAARKGYFKTNIGKIQVVDPYTVRIHSTGVPIPDFLSIMSPLYDSTEQLIISQKAFNQLGHDGFATNPVGSGPYRFIEHVGGQYIKFEAVNNHWRLGVPRFKNIFFQAVPEEETAIAMLLRGDVDMIPLSRSNIKRVKEKGVNVILHKSMSGIGIWIDGQFVKELPTSNEKVREALNLAIDRQSIVDKVFLRMGKPLGTFYTTSLALEKMGYNWKEDLYAYDPGKAQKLLTEAGYPKGFKLEVYAYPYIEVSEGVEVMQIVAGMWTAIGVQTKVILTEYGVVRAKRRKGEMYGMAGYFPAQPRAWQGTLGFYQQFLHSGASAPFIKSAEMDKIIDRACQALDDHSGQAALMEAAKYVRRHHHAFPICEFDLAYGVSKKIGDWNPGNLPGDLNLDNLFRNK